MSTVLVVPAFGRGIRFGADKLWADIEGRPLIALTLSGAAASGCFDAAVIAAPAERWDALAALASRAGLEQVTFVEGGARRQDSVGAALSRCEGHEIVCVHDAARPLAPPSLFAAVVTAARKDGAATAAVPCVDTIKRVAEGYVVETIDRSSVVAAQTPQAFRRKLLADAHAAAARDGTEASDDAVLVERLGVRVAVVPGSSRNIKVTAAEDLDLVRTILARS